MAFTFIFSPLVQFPERISMLQSLRVEADIIFVNHGGIKAAGLGILNISAIFAEPVPAWDHHYKTDNEEEHCTGNRWIFRGSSDIL